MKNKLNLISFCFVLITLQGCSFMKDWAIFDMQRYAFAFIITLVIGVIGLIAMIFSRKNDK